MGKSTLVAQFLLEHANRYLPFIYIDLDRPSIDPRNPVALLAEAQRQLSLQAPQAKAMAETAGLAFQQASLERATPKHRARSIRSTKR